MTEVSGLAVRMLPMFVRDNHGEKGYQKWYEALPAASKSIFENTVAVEKWFPLEKCFIEPTEILCSLFYQNKERGAWEIGRFSADYALKGVLKVFIKLGSVNFFIKRAAAVIPNYYKPGTVEVIENGPGKAILRLTGFRSMHPLIENRIAGWMERAMEISGCKMRLVTITKSMSKNDPYTEYKVIWK